MARVVVVGGGFGGLAAAARLAKLRHEVTLLERAPALGGALGTVSADGFTWDAGPAFTLLPAVVRDLFRKSGRPLERELGVEVGTELEPLAAVREHRFTDRSVLRLPGGSRAAQVAAFDALGPGLGEEWADHVAGFAGDWDLLRRHVFEVPAPPGTLPREVLRVLETRETLHRRLRRDLRDERLAQVAAHPAVAEGHDLRNVPAWVGLVSYLEQRFGAWRMPPLDGAHRPLGTLTDLLVARLGTRGVTVLTDTEALDVVVRQGRACAVATRSGEIDADVVVCAVDPRRLPLLAPHVARTMPAIPPVVTHLGLEGPVPPIEPGTGEVVVHGDPLIVIRPGGVAPAGATAWTLHGRGRLAEDMLDALARSGLDVRERVVTRVDRSPRDLVTVWGGSPCGVLWQGRATARRRLGPRTPVPGVYAAGAHATPGAGLPYVGLSAALVAQVIGPA